MNTEKQEYLLLFRSSKNWQAELSLEELQQAMSKIKGWFDELGAKGIIKGAKPLGEEGHIVSGQGGHVVSDGPFAESKEAIGGYLLIEADSLAEAVKVAQGNPTLAYGDRVEVRVVADQCPKTTYALEKLGAKDLACAGV